MKASDFEIIKQSRCPSGLVTLAELTLEKRNWFGKVTKERSQIFQTPASGWRFLESGKLLPSPHLIEALMYVVEAKDMPNVAVKL